MFMALYSLNIFNKFDILYMVVFWFVTPCRLVCGYQRFGGTYYFHFQGPETLVPTYKSRWRHNPEDQHGHLHRRENLKSHTL
jgi:hypothetical protein